MLITLAAAAVAVPTDLARAAERPAYVEAVSQAALQFAAMRAHAPCPAGATVSLSGQLSLGPADVSGADSSVAPGAKAYKQHVHVARCGVEVRQDNVFVVRKSGGGWFTAAMMPGDSLTTPVQQHDALRSAMAAVRIAATGPCTNGQPPYQLLDTRVTNTSLLKSAGLWEERWVQTSCGEDRSVQITFTPRPDGKATSVIVRQDWPQTTP